MIYAVAALVVWCLVLTFVLYGVARPPVVKMDPHLEAALDSMRVMADFIESSDELLLKAGLIPQRSTIVGWARGFADKIERNAGGGGR